MIDRWERSVTLSIQAGLVVVLFCVSFSTAFAATIYVNSSTGDDATGDGSSGTPYQTFDKAYTEASSGDTIDLTGTFDWSDAAEDGDSTSTGYTLSKSLTIQGQGADETFVQASSTSNTAGRRVFTISTGNAVTFADVTIRYGHVTSGTSRGGAIFSQGTTTLNRVTVSDSYVSVSGSGYGGGIALEDTVNGGSLTVRDSTITNNYAASQGGGIWNGTNTTGDIDIINSTITFNSQAASVATVGGAGIAFRNGGGSITNSTIAYNNNVNGGTANGPGLWSAGSGTIVLKNSIITSNYIGGVVSSGGYYDIYKTGGSITDNGANIVGKNNSSIFTLAATSWVDQVNIGATDGTYVLQDGSGTTSGTLNLAASLADNSTGQGTQTLALESASSIAVDNGLSTDNGSISIPSTDQRNAPRVGDTDIGAFEYGGTPPGGSGGGGGDTGGGSGDRLVTPPEPSVSVHEVDATTIEVYGTYDGRKIVTDEVGIEYWMDDDDVETVVLGDRLRSFHTIVRELTCDTEYEIRAYAENALARTYSDTESFTTGACVPDETDEEEDESAANTVYSDTVTTPATLPALVALLEEARAKLAAMLAGELSSTDVSTDLLNRDLQLGDEGGDVKELQLFLIEQNTGPSAQELARVGATGYFGTYTKNALGEFQLEVGIMPHMGYFGQLTRSYLSENY